MVQAAAKECGLGDDQIIDVFNAMGGAQLSRPDLYCSGRHCDGYHPVDEGQQMIASTILSKIIDFYMKKP